MENECSGNYSSWRCICKGPKYMQHPRDIQACMEGKRMFCSSLYIPNKNIPKDGYTSSKRNSCRRIAEDFRIHLFDQVKNYILNTVNKFFLLIIYLYLFTEFLAFALLLFINQFLRNLIYSILLQNFKNFLH